MQGFRVYTIFPDFPLSASKLCLQDIPHAHAVFDPSRGNISTGAPQSYRCLRESGEWILIIGFRV